MKRKGLVLALLLLLLVNAVVLAGVAYNRSGAPHARMVLTPRELPQGWGFGFHGDRGEDSGMSLRIDWQRDMDTYEHIMTRKNLEAIGFRFPALGDTEDWKYRKNLLDRKAYVVLEYDGEAWAGLFKRKQAELEKSLDEAKDDNQRQNRQQQFDYFQKTASRLVLVDMGPDAAALRARYTDHSKFLIAKAQVAAYGYYKRDRRNETEYRIQAHVAALLPQSVYVPRQYHGLISKSEQERHRFDWKFDPDKPDMPGYRVTLAYGQRDEPWVESVSIVPPAVP